MIEKIEFIELCDVPWPPKEEKPEAPAGHKDPPGATGECALRRFCEHLRREKDNDR